MNKASEFLKQCWEGRKPMRLTDLSPKWIGPEQWSNPAPIFRIGVSFVCPHCGARLAYRFNNPIDPEGLVGRVFDWPHHPDWWTRTSGDNFETLSIIPSINVMGHIHMTLTKGEVTYT